jgi:uncharacterized membrane protein
MYMLITFVVICFAWYWLNRLEDKWDTKHPAHHDSRPGSFWYESHKKERR